MVGFIQFLFSFALRTTIVGIGLFCAWGIWSVARKCMFPATARKLPWHTLTVLAVFAFVTVLISDKPPSGRTVLERLGSRTCVVRSLSGDSIEDVPCITSIVVTSIGVDLILHRPVSEAISPEIVAITGTASLETETWDTLSSVMFAAGECDCRVIVPSEILGAHGMSDMGVFSFARFRDTDGDGLLDNEEMGHVERGRSFSPASTDRPTSLTLANGVCTVALPFSMNFGGVSSQEVIVSEKGIMAFPVSGSNAVFNPGGQNLRMDVPVFAADYAAVVAVYWDDLMPSTDAGLLRGVSCLTTMVDGVTRVEIFFYSPGIIGTSSALDTSDCLQARIVLFSDDPSSVYVVYDACGSSFTGATATIGAQGPCRRASLPVSYNMPVESLARTVLAYHFGTGTNPFDSDSDGDNITDGEEIVRGSDPLNPMDGLLPVDADLFRELTFSVSGDYAAWDMTLEGLGPYDTYTRHIEMAAPGLQASKTLPLRKGNSYRISLNWLGSNGHSDAQAPWFCWGLTIDGQPTEKTYEDYSCFRRFGVSETVLGDGWIAENSQGLLTTHIHEPTYWLNGDPAAGNVAEGLTATLHVLGAPRLVFDYDRDGIIDSDDAEKARDRHSVFRFWLNDDADEGDVCSGSGDRPGSGPNYGNGLVDGRRDLLDFTPVWIDLSDVFSPIVPASVRRLLTWKVQSTCVNAVWTYLTRDRAGAFQREDGLYEFGWSVSDLPEVASVADLTTGATLPAVLAEALAGDPQRGVFLIEGKTAQDGLLDGNLSDLSIQGVIGDRVMASGEALLRISSVEKMYRWIGLRNVVDGEDIDPAEVGTDDPPNWPDSERDGRHFVFVHGYNVSATEARDWAAEMFKRLWQSGSNAQFSAVDWFGNYSQLFGVAPNYWANVVHAIETADTLAAVVNTLPGTKIMLAHSLGNALTSEACKYHGLEYARYYMLNAAIASETYDTLASPQDNMIAQVWWPYPEELRSANWSDVFPESDGRKRLRWRSRYAGLENVINCFSPTEDVLRNPQLVGFGGAWGFQELSKGTTVMSVMPTVRREGGWAFNMQHVRLEPGGEELTKTTFTQEELKTTPPFLPFYESWLHVSEAISNEDVEPVMARIIADGIPATTFAAGANEIGGILENVNYHTLMTNMSQWPKLDDENCVIWEHSDLKNVAYRFVFRLFDRIVQGE